MRFVEAMTPFMQMLRCYNGGFPCGCGGVRVVAGHEIIELMGGSSRLCQHARKMKIVSLLCRTVVIGERKLTKRVSTGTGTRQTGVNQSESINAGVF
jgi:hypothetical protein